MYYWLLQHRHHKQRIQAFFSCWTEQFIETQIPHECLFKVKALSSHKHQRGLSSICGPYHIARTSENSVVLLQRYYRVTMSEDQWRHILPTGFNGWTSCVLCDCRTWIFPRVHTHDRICHLRWLIQATLQSYTSDLGLKERFAGRSHRKNRITETYLKTLKGSKCLWVPGSPFTHVKNAQRARAVAVLPLMKSSVSSLWSVCVSVCEILR